MSALVVLGGLGALFWTPCLDHEAIAEIDTAVTAEVMRITEGDLARADGYIYTVDVAQLMIVLARRGDEVAFRGLADQVLPYLWRDDPSDPYTRGFVPWRFKQGEPPDASGTTEALRLADALWLGSERFEHPQWRRQAVVILEGYCRHAFEEQGIWLIRNYFNFQTRAFANDSFLVDYHPDLLARAAQASDGALRLSAQESRADIDTRRRRFAEVAEQTYTVVRRAQASTGLFRSMVQPDVATLLPERDLAFFAPDGIVQLNNSCAVAESVVEGDPQVARKLLDFAVGRLLGLKRYYDVNTGAYRGEKRAGVATWTCLVRLAARLDDEEAARRLARHTLWHWETTVEYGIHAPRLYTAGEVLLAIEWLQSRWPSTRH